MSGLGERLDALVWAAAGEFHPTPVEELVRAGRRRRARRRVAAATVALSAAATLLSAVAVDGGRPMLRVTASPPPATAPTSESLLAAITARSVAAVRAVPGPPAAFGEVVATTAAMADQLLNGPTAVWRPVRGSSARIPAAAAISARPDVAVWWVLIARHQSCPTGCADGAVPPTDYVAVLLRSSDLGVLVVKSLGSNEPDLALAGPVFPIVVAGRTLPARQPAVTDAVVPATTVEASALNDDGCSTPVHLSGLRDLLPASGGRSHCTSVSIRLFPDWAALASTVPGVGEPGLAYSQPSRPVYYVTIWGQLGFSPLTQGLAPAYVDHDNSFYDAITGRGEGGGTAGEPLP